MSWMYTLVMFKEASANKIAFSDLLHTYSTIGFNWKIDSCHYHLSEARVITKQLCADHWGPDSPNQKVKTYRKHPFFHPHPSLQCPERFLSHSMSSLVHRPGRWSCRVLLIVYTDPWNSSSQYSWLSPRLDPWMASSSHHRGNPGSPLAPLDQLEGWCGWGVGSRLVLGKAIFQLQGRQCVVVGSWERFWLVDALIFL